MSNKDEQSSKKALADRDTRVAVVCACGTEMRTEVRDDRILGEQVMTCLGCGIEIWDFEGEPTHVVDDQDGIMLSHPAMLTHPIDGQNYEVILGWNLENNIAIILGSKGMPKLEAKHEDDYQD